MQRRVTEERDLLVTFLPPFCFPLSSYLLLVLFVSLHTSCISSFYQFRLVFFFFFLVAVQHLSSLFNACK